jgi:membrane protein
VNGVAEAALQPVPGRQLDPAPSETPAAVQRLERADNRAGRAAAIGFRTFTRFKVARATLLAAGTTYYVFLALFSLVALGYGLTALLGADGIADYLTRALAEAFPGLLGDDGIDPALLRSIGQTAGLLGLVVMLYSGGGAMVAASGSIHLIYGAPVDPRSFVVKRLRLLGWLLVIGPLIMGSLVAGIATQNFSSEVMSLFGWQGGGDRVLVSFIAFAVTLALDSTVVFLMLSRLGGIRPPTRPLVIGALVGAVLLQLLRVAMGLILEVSADKPQYGALTLPIGILLVLYLNTLAVFGVAALTAGIAERDVPIDEILAVSDEPDGEPAAEHPADHDTTGGPSNVHAGLHPNEAPGGDHADDRPNGEPGDRSPAEVRDGHTR